MRARSLVSVALAAALVSLPGCGNAETYSDLSTNSGVSSASSGSNLPDYVVRADGVLEAVPFRGIRRVWQLHGAASGVTPEPLSVVEEVAGDGAGSFSIELMDVLELPSTMESSLFPLTHERSVDVYWRTRDFRIRGISRAEQNYAFIEHAGSFSVAGHACRRVEIQRLTPIGGRPGRYVVDIEPSTGFVLASRELDAQGQEIQSMSYDSISFSPDFAGLDLRDGTFAGSSLDLFGSLDGTVGFDVLVPDVLPQGFELTDARLFSVPSSFTANAESFLSGGDWVRFTGADGIESITFAHGNTMSVSSGIVESSIRIVSEGAWEYGFGRVAGVSFVVAGRVDPQDLRRLVESAF